MKRRRVVEDDDDGDENDGIQPEDTPDTSFVDDNYEETELNNRADQIVIDALRFVLARESSDHSIRRSHIGKFSGRNRIYTIDGLIEAINQQLKRIFGLQLVETGSGTGQYIVLKHLDDVSNEILGDLWQQEVNQSLENELVFKLVGTESKTTTPLTNPELIKTGVFTLVICLLVVSENNLQESELLSKLQLFGISNNLNDRNQVLNMNYKELIIDMIRKQYLSKRANTVHGTTNTSETYTLGSRALMEIPSDKMLLLVKTIYGDKFPDVEEKVVKTIGRAYE
ncbi:uncharacterized protein KQ657_002294 [Scheffersomyces spartinae]|uniref:MAGE domain-containing protein n=1 Tax=Scheffersomyces spartinae TaxID=45513 RepID=A0A9P7VDP0_9ASCO|nr:uncharacterized protein KQ657_002294 [Scheffersomyces spartinae]KAG7195909.1 hypothetical protein KQ657_002294 [Scheffersomyces spartinae]